MAQKLYHDGVIIPPHECAKILKYVCLKKHKTVSFIHCATKTKLHSSFDYFKNQLFIDVVIGDNIIMKHFTDPNNFAETIVTCDEYWLLIMKLLCELNIHINKLFITDKDLTKLFLITLVLMKYSNIRDINWLLLRTFFDKKYFGKSSNIYVLESESKLVLLQSTFCGTVIYVNKNHTHEQKIAILMTKQNHDDTLVYRSPEKCILKVENNLLSNTKRKFYIIGESNSNVEENVVYIMFKNLHTDNYSRIISTLDIQLLDTGQHQMHERLQFYSKQQRIHELITKYSNKTYLSNV